MIFVVELTQRGKSVIFVVELTQRGKSVIFVVELTQSGKSMISVVELMQSSNPIREGNPLPGESLLTIRKNPVMI